MIVTCMLQKIFHLAHAVLVQSVKRYRSAAYFPRQPRPLLHKVFQSLLNSSRTLATDSMREPEPMNPFGRVFCFRIFYDVPENLTDQQQIFAARLVAFHDNAFLYVLNARCKTGTSLSGSLSHWLSLRDHAIRGAAAASLTHAALILSFKGVRDFTMLEVRQS
jgi:hypothetical protein